MSVRNTLSLGYRYRVHGTITVFLGLVVVFLWVRKPSEPERVPSRFTPHSLFSVHYPASPEVEAELFTMLGKGEISSSEESMVRENVDSVAEQLAMPPAILWCLLFQESRLDNLIGINTNRFAHGLGQFSLFSFFEINYRTSQFSDDNLKMMLTTLGADVRPIRLNRDSPYDADSYYNIPTAVVASASYLNNRYAHLTSLLARNGISYDRDLMWLWAATSYNKGTRSVLSLWKQLRIRGGEYAVQRAVSDKRYFREAIANRALLEKSLQRIWPAETAIRYSKEWGTHIKAISACSLRPDQGGA